MLMLHSSEDRIAWTDIFCFKLSLDFVVVVLGLCSFCGRERKSENMNTFSVQSFMLFLMAHSDSPCNCCNQVAEETHSESISFYHACLSGLRMWSQAPSEDEFSLGSLHMEFG